MTFFVNLGHRWTATNSLIEPHGCVFLPAGNNRERLLAKTIPAKIATVFDPQLYLAGLDGTDPKYAVACGRLVGYPWFAASNVPECDQPGESPTQWEKRCRAQVSNLWPGAATTDPSEVEKATRACLEFQAKMGCTHFLSASCLVQRRESEGMDLAQWLDATLRAARALKLEAPLIASVPISAGTLDASAFELLGLLERVVDNVVARDGFQGVYIVVVNEQSKSPFETPKNVLRAYLRLARMFARCSYEHVWVNFAGVWSIPCLAVGASGAMLGSSQSGRRIAFEAYAKRAGSAQAVPHLYSHPTVMELATETDIAQVVRADLLDLVRDETSVSKPLFDVLDNGGTAASVGEWAESGSNTTAAKAHFLERLAIEVNGLVAEPDVKKRNKTVSAWLLQAASNSSYVRKEAAGVGRRPNLEVWRQVFKEESLLL